MPTITPHGRAHGGLSWASTAQGLCLTISPGLLFQADDGPLRMGP
jgi:hypothetical protein